MSLKFSFKTPVFFCFMGFWEFKFGFWVLLTIVVGFEPFNNLGRCIRCRFPRSSCQTPRKRLLRRFRSCCLFCFSLRRIQLFLLSAFTRLTVRSALVGGRHGFESRLGRSFLAISLSLALSLSLSRNFIYGLDAPKIGWGATLPLYEVLPRRLRRDTVQWLLEKKVFYI